MNAIVSRSSRYQRGILDGTSARRSGSRHGGRRPPTRQIAATVLRSRGHLAAKFVSAGARFVDPEDPVDRVCDPRLGGFEGALRAPSGAASTAPQ